VGGSRRRCDLSRPRAAGRLSLLPLASGGLGIDHSSGSPRLPQADYVGYVRRLEQTLILALARLGVPAFQVDGLTGVWVNTPKASEGVPDAKIAAIGVKVDARGVSRTALL